MRARSLVVVMALAATAAADGTTFQGKVVTAETAERNAHDSRDPAAFEVCGQAYVEVASAARTEMPDMVPEAMYNAAVCFEEARSISAALALYQRLEAELPRHQLVPRALARRARLHMAMGWYAEAAKELETFAARYAGERDASDALENAVRLRAALGDDDAARANAERWLKTFGAKQPRQAAEAALFLAWRVRERGTPDDAVRTYREWLKRHGGRGVTYHTVAAHAAIGEIQWDQSCQVKGTAKGGLCVAPARTAAAPRCGKAPPVAVARDARLAKEATLALTQAIRIAEADPSNELAVVYADQARLRLADAKLELALAMELTPAGVDATGRMTPASQKEQMAWLGTWQKQLGDAQRAYEQLLRAKNLRVSVLAAGRIAWLSQHAADTLTSAPLPELPKAKAEELRTLYCDALGDVAASLNVRAKEAADACLTVAGQVNVVEETAQCVTVFDRHHPAAAGAGERLPVTAMPRVRDVEPAIRYRPRGVAAPVTPSPP